MQRRPPDYPSIADALYPNLSRETKQREQAQARQREEQQARSKRLAQDLRELNAKLANRERGG
jgi:hypothetical protein